MQDTSSTSIRTTDGTRIGYTLRGASGDAVPHVVLVHSLALDRSVWARVADLLSDRCAVLTWDCRGHGESSKPAGPYTLQAFANDLAALLDAVGWKDAHVAGCSMGGNVSLQFAALYPERVRTLGLVDTTAWYGADAPARWDERADRALDAGLASMLDFQESRWFSDAFRAMHPEVTAHLRERFVANSPQAFAETCHMLGRFDLRGELPSLTMPVAIAVGEDDYATPTAMARDLEAHIGGATLTVIPKARHLTPLEVPDTIAGLLTTLIARDTR